MRAAAPVARRAGCRSSPFPTTKASPATASISWASRPTSRSAGWSLMRAPQGRQRFGGAGPDRALWPARGAGAARRGAASRAAGWPRSKPTTARQAVDHGRRTRLNAKGAFDAVLIADASRMAALAAPVLKAGPRRLGTELWANRPDDRRRLLRLRGAWFAAAPDDAVRPARHPLSRALRQDALPAGQPWL